VSEELIPLSEREMEIVQLLATGATNQQIARDLDISVNTVKVHLRNIYGKLDVASRTEATMVAVREGWVDVPGLLEEEKEVEGARVPEVVASPFPSALPQLDRERPVPVSKRIVLVAATLVAVMLLFLPMLIAGQANGRDTDPIGSVFPTVPSGPPAERWHTRAQMPTPRNGLAVAAHGGLVYAIGGVGNDGATGRVEVYDPVLDAWMTRRSKPTPAGFVSAAVVGDKIYVPGGIGVEREFEKVLEVYDPLNDVWGNAAPIPEPLAAYGLAVLDEELYLFGGRNEQGYLDSVIHYDPRADRWQELEPMAQARAFLGAVALGERIYVMGGHDGVAEFENCEAFDPATGTWTSLAPMDQGRGGLVAVAVRDYVYVIGGGMTGYLAFNERYDPRVNLWSRIETPVEEQWRGLGAAFVYPSIYAIGGWSGRNLSVNEAYQALFQIQVPLVEP
jgi:DNA-binding CsgD family transcriptional regulator/N-acetylneuraminic acid mutarotase